MLGKKASEAPAVEEVDMGLAKGAARGNQRHGWQRMAHTRPYPFNL